MSEPATLAGMTAEEALARVLRMRGHRETRRDLRGDGSIEAMLHELDACAIDARMARLGPDDLRFLDPPALIQLQDGSWLLLLREGGRGEAVVETADGVRRVSAAALQAHATEGALQILPQPPADRNVWHRVGALLVDKPRVLVQIAAASLLMVLLALIPPQITRLVMDRAIPSGAMSLLTIITIALIAVTLFQAWTSWLRARAILYLKSRAEAIMETELLAHLLSLPFAFLSGKTTGQLLQGFAGLGAARGMLTDQALGAVADGVTAVLYLAVMLAMMPGPTGGVVVVAAVSGALALFIGRLQARLQKRETEANSRQRDFLVELLSGVATVKASGAEMRGLRQWLERLRLEYSIRLRRQRISLWYDAGQSVVMQSSNVMLLVWGALLVLRGESSLGSLLAFLQMSSGFIGAVLGLIGTYLTVRVLRPRLAELREILAADPQPRPRRGHGARLTGPVVFDNVWFRYREDGPWVLKEFNMEVQPGEKRWVRGPSGAGKSTILRLLSGLYSPERGAIRIGGRDPLSANELMIYLPQLLQLYGGSILENLRLFSGNASRERLMAAAEASGLDKLIARLPLGIETIIPSGGMTLSGGERQLIAMTAVMASDRSLFLLDEAMVSLDWITRASVEHNRWFDGKTIIYASHDGFAADATSTFIPKDARA